jgi:hypothetical protein
METLSSIFYPLSSILILSSCHLIARSPQIATGCQIGPRKMVTACYVVGPLPTMRTESKLSIMTMFAKRERRTMPAQTKGLDATLNFVWGSRLDRRFNLIERRSVRCFGNNTRIIYYLIILRSTHRNSKI